MQFWHNITSGVLKISITIRIEQKTDCKLYQKPIIIMKFSIKLFTVNIYSKLSFNELHWNKIFVFIFLKNLSSDDND